MITLKLYWYYTNKNGNQEKNPTQNEIRTFLSHQQIRLRKIEIF